MGWREEYITQMEESSLETTILYLVEHEQRYFHFLDIREFLAIGGFKKIVEVLRY